jgi:copper chaperone
MSTTVHRVKGMTCGHCVSSVSAEIGKLAGVTDVAVDLDTGEVTVTSSGDLAPAVVRAAVDEAGYELVG